MSEMPDGVTVETRTYKGHRVRWAYHEECDDGYSDGDGHMSVVDENGEFFHECSTCGFSVPYSSVDTGLPNYSL
jgi:hypothetical protein